MSQDNIMEFCQWLMTEKGIEAGNLSDYINNNEAEVLELANKFNNVSSFKIGGKIDSAANKFKCGGKTKKVKKAQDGEKMSGKDYRDIKLNRGVIRRAAKQNFGFNNAQFQTAYENAKYGFRNQGLNRREANIAAQKAMINKPAEESKLPSMQIGLNRDFNFDNVDNDLEIDTNPVISYNPVPYGNNRPSGIPPYLGIYTGTMKYNPYKNQPNFRTKTMPGRFGLAHYQSGGTMKSYKDEDPITIPVKIDDKREGFVSYNNDGTVKSTIRRYTDPWDGTVEPQVALTHRVTTPDSTAMYVQYGPVDEHNRRGYLYNTAQKIGARERANRGKFDPMFDDIERRANARLNVLPNGRLIINDVVHTDNDTFSRIIDRNDTTIVNSNLDRFNNNSLRTKLARKIFGTSAFDEADKNFKDIDFQQKGGIIKERISFGPEYTGFTDNTGKYKRVVTTNQDTTWVYQTPDDKIELKAFPTSYGYGGYKIDSAEGSDILPPHAAEIVRRDVESRIKNIPHKKYLIEKYGKEMFLPENLMKVKK